MVGRRQAHLRSAFAGCMGLRDMRGDVLTEVLWFATMALAFMTVVGPLWLYYFH